MVVYPEQVFYCMVKPDDVPEIVEEHLLKGRPVQRLIYEDAVRTGRRSSGGYRLLPQAETDRLTQLRRDQSGKHRGVHCQRRLRSAGQGADGDDAGSGHPDYSDSGIRGRGYGRLPTGLKWKFASGNRGKVEKYVCCNADEGDPGALWTVPFAGG